MGLDARIYVDGAVDLSAEFKEDIGDCLSHWAHHGGDRVYTGIVEGWTWIEGYERYFSEAYDRGHWPRIKKAIQRTMEEFPGRAVHYGADSDVAPDWAAPVTPELLAHLDEAWSSRRKT